MDELLFGFIDIVFCNEIITSAILIPVAFFVASIVRKRMRRCRY